MAPPKLFPCGEPGQPACPPQPAADSHENMRNVIRWYHALEGHHQQEVIAACFNAGAPAPSQPQVSDL